MRRVTKPGGLVAIRDADYAGMFWAPADPRLDHWMDVYRKVAKHNDAEPDAGRFLLRWALDAGFTDIEPSASTWLFATDADREYWGGTWAERAVAVSVRRAGGAVRLRHCRRSSGVGRRLPSVASCT